MRKWLWLGIPTLTFLCVGGSYYWFKGSSGNVPERGRDNAGLHVKHPVNADGDAEQSDLIEPLVVERVGVTSAPSMPTAVEVGPMARVLLTPGMTQPPRPDAETGRVVRMPYADEEEILGISFDPIQRIMESKLAWLDIFANLQEKEEEAEPQEEVASASPLIPPHPSHCPHMGGCPAPYYPFRR